MTAYVILILFIFLWRGVTLIESDRKKANEYFLSGVFIYLYIFCVIRSFDIGRDIPGYINGYNHVANMAWNDWEMFHFEIGYIFLMKICNLIGLSVRGFFYVVYFIILYPIYYLFKTESPRPLITVLVFICFQYFVFDLSGLRQAMASSLCFLAFMVSLKKGKKYLLWFAILVTCASLLHKSALAFAITYSVVRLPLNKKTIIIYIVLAIICFIINIAGVGAILSYYGSTTYEYSTDESQQLGGTLIFVILFAFLGILLSWYSSPDAKEKKQISIYTLMTITGICAMFLANGSVLLRATMYFYFPIMLIPAYLSERSIFGLGRIIKIALMVVLLTHFFISEINSFDVSPYEIGKDQYIFRNE